MTTGIIHRYHFANRQQYNLVPAEFKDRLIAQLIDGIILGLFCGLIFFIFSKGEVYSVWAMPFIPVYLLQVADAHVNSFSDFWWGGAYFTIDSPFGSNVFVNYPSPLLWVGYALYYTVFTAIYGQTPGKMFKKLVVTTQNEQKPGFARSFCRWVGYLISIFSLGFGFLIAAREGQAAWHDAICVTRVYQFDANS